MAVVLSFTPCPPLLQARRRAAPSARFDGSRKRWTMSGDEYAAFWLEALAARRDRLITVHEVDGHEVDGHEVDGRRVDHSPAAG